MFDRRPCTSAMFANWFISKGHKCFQAHRDSSCFFKLFSSTSLRYHFHPLSLQPLIKIGTHEYRFSQLHPTNPTTGIHCPTSIHFFLCQLSVSAISIQKTVYNFLIFCFFPEACHSCLSPAPAAISRLKHFYLSRVTYYNSCLWKCCYLLSHEIWDRFRCVARRPIWSQLYGSTTVVMAINGLHWKWQSLT